MTRRLSRKKTRRDVGLRTYYRTQIARRIHQRRLHQLGGCYVGWIPSGIGRVSLTTSPNTSMTGRARRQHVKRVGGTVREKCPDRVEVE